MPLWLRTEFADKENFNEVDLFIDEILSDYYIFNKFMKCYDVSMKSLNIPNSEINRLRNKYYDEFLDNEETPKYNDIVYQRKESEKERMLYNKELSCFCNDIYECLEILLKELKKKPYFGDKLDFYKKIINTVKSSKTTYPNPANLTLPKSS